MKFDVDFRNVIGRGTRVLVCTNLGKNRRQDFFSKKCYFGGLNLDSSDFIRFSMKFYVNFENEIGKIGGSRLNFSRNRHSSPRNATSEGVEPGFPHQQVDRHTT
jgi:hypothetical protein